ncbi:MAG: TIGR02391 family protein, partial [Prevotella nigrescens]|nr:TIGR02391 family protein [Prevotella nigrescens]
SKLFIDGYYRQAVLDATIGLVNRVKQKSQCYELDNTPLMQNVFSPNKPILKISKSKDIQQGIMWLFSGAIMAFRNAHAHKLNCQITKNECLEQLHFISYLHRILDKSKLNPT